MHPMMDPRFLKHYREEIVREAEHSHLAHRLRRARKRRAGSPRLQTLEWEFERYAGRLLKLFKKFGR